MIIRRNVDADRGRVWLRTSERIRDILTGRSESDLGRAVRGAGGPSPLELLAAVVTVGAAALTGNIRGIGDAVAEEPPAQGLGELLGAWEAQSDDVARLVRSDPAAGRLLVDLVCLEHDLRDAFGCPGERGNDAVLVALEIAAEALSERLDHAGIPTLRLTCEEWSHDTGWPPYHAILVADRYELFRALTGRRSADEIRRWMWSSDPVEYVHHLVAWGSLRDNDMEEFDPAVPPEYAELLRRKSWREPA